MRKNKYGNKKTVVDGITFDSMSEARRYQELLLLQKAGKIDGLRLQTPWPLFACCERGKKELIKTLIGKYVSDFDYFDNDTGSLIVEDVKGYKTPLFNWKWKHLQSQYYGAIFRIIK